MAMRRLRSERAGYLLHHVNMSYQICLKVYYSREMDQVFDGLRATVAGVHREMKEELDKSKKEIEKVDSTLKSLLTIK